MGSCAHGALVQTAMPQHHCGTGAAGQRRLPPADVPWKALAAAAARERCSTSGSRCSWRSSSFSTPGCTQMMAACLGKEQSGDTSRSQVVA